MVSIVVQNRTASTISLYDSDGNIVTVLRPLGLAGDTSAAFDRTRMDNVPAFNTMMGNGTLKLISTALTADNVSQSNIVLVDSAGVRWSITIDITGNLIQTQLYY